MKHVLFYLILLFPLIVFADTANTATPSVSQAMIIKESPYSVTETMDKFRANGSKLNN